jgi:type VI secretion system secreted protein Hcp
VKQRKGDRQTAVSRPRAGGPTGVRRSGPSGSVLALQGMAGNRAVAGLMRSPTPHSRTKAKMLVRIKGRKQGVFKGTGPEGAIEGFKFEMEITSPRDVSTGQAAGKRQHKALTFQKPMDAASPMLMQALVSNEVLDEVRIEFVSRDDTAGTAKTVETIVLKNAAVAALKQASDDDDSDTDTVSLIYEAIEITNNQSNTSASDDWNAK